MPTSPSPPAPMFVTVPVTTRHLRAAMLYCGTAQRSVATQVQSLVGIKVITWVAALDDVASGKAPAEPLHLPARVDAADNAVRVPLSVEDLAVLKAVGRCRTMPEVLGLVGGIIAEWAEPICGDMRANGMAV